MASSGSSSSSRPVVAWVLRIAIAVLFFVSGLAKLFPITAFEKQIFDLFDVAFCHAQYFARFILALEFAIAIGLLQPHYLKRFVLPVTALVLLAFNVHLGMEIYATGGGEGSCGCFGQWLPMTPMEAFLKNWLTLALVGWLAYLLPESKKVKHNFAYILLIFTTAAAAMFALRPFCPCEQPVEDAGAWEEEVDSDGLTWELAVDSTAAAAAAADSVANAATNASATPSPTAVQQEGAAASVPAPAAPAVDPGPAAVKSVFAGYRQFGPKQINLDKGKKLVCMFHPDCDHCKETAAKICAMPRTAGMPEVVILFLDEDADRIPAFFDAAGCRAPYQVIGHGPFFDLLGSGSDTPGVFCLWNGNVVASFEGSGERAWDEAKFRQAFKLSGK